MCFWDVRSSWSIIMWNWADIFNIWLDNIWWPTVISSTAGSCSYLSAPTVGPELFLILLWNACREHGYNILTWTQITLVSVNHCDCIFKMGDPTSSLPLQCSATSAVGAISRNLPISFEGISQGINCLVSHKCGYLYLPTYI